MTPTLLSMELYILTLFPVVFWSTEAYHLKNNVSDNVCSEIKYRHKTYLVDQLSECEVIT